MRVGLLTMFNGLGSSYSIVNVVATHVEMFLKSGVEVSMIVTEQCQDSERVGVFSDPRIEWIKIVNSKNGEPYHWRDYCGTRGTVHDSFYREVDCIAEDFVNKLGHIDFCIMHDILYQGWHLLHNVAIRKASNNLSNVKFFAFTHSIPAPHQEAEYPFNMRYTHMEGVTYLYPTYSGLVALANQYNTTVNNCRAVYNTVPLIQDEHVKKINEKFNVLDADILIVYPARLTTGKKPEKITAFAGAMTEVTGLLVKVIFCDFASMDIAPDEYKEIIRCTGEEYGLSRENVLFTTDLGYASGLPRDSVMELFKLSNLYVCPSYSESFGLTVLEAGSSGNYVVLNAKVPALLELGETIGAYFMNWDARNFGFGTIETYHPSEKEYYKENAQIIWQNMQNDTSLKIKQKIKQVYNDMWIYENQIKPLLF